MAGRFWIVLLLLFSFQRLNAQAESEVNTDLVAMGEADADAQPYWEYGAGLGYVHYQHYPAANQFSNLLLPFPTFQYRGKIVRADDRNGAHIYLLKGPDWVFEMSGAGYPALDSSTNEARQGMEDLPWMLAIGPQFVYSMTKGFKLSLGPIRQPQRTFE